MVRLIKRELETLRERCTGRVVTEQDPRYDVARALWNGAVDHRPAAIVRCTGPGDVSAAIRFAREEELEISVRGGGHDVGGSAVTSGGLMVDLSGLRRVRVDPASRRAVCEGGATWADLDAATQAHGLATPGGTVSHTGVGGLTLGGGFGWLTRMHGLSADNLQSADLILADGQYVHASARDHPDLFWAIRGGGGNFGVVTGFTFRLHPVGPEVHFALLFWEAERGPEALLAIEEAIAGLPRRAGVLAAYGLTAPPAPFVPPPHRSRPGHALLIAGFGSAEEHRATVTGVEDMLRPLFTYADAMPYPRLQAFLDATAPWGVHAYERALDLAAITPRVAATLCEQAALKGSAMTFMPSFRLDGEFCAVDDAATAYGGSRLPHHTLCFTALTPSPEALPAERAWSRAAWEAVLPHAMGAGSYVNFQVEREADRVRAAYGAEKYGRLAAVKAVYDPDNVFHLNANIRPARRSRHRAT
ncbi:FAD-binding oxidoreductase [Nonomuraea sp. 3-1Str]|uniref:FAD-binding oxidoreductase n=1 Tax=Nonomuraea sp. 3-1Str TaxID=2929801 RepID=UPI00285A36CB|nr:FAD-binding oxidoreductase [Nonomuraea sp. 3-1Str]MDR8414795.1 FAD-binding oxidoreductase [Nonomuraea sp. 3-1Str]